MTNTQNDPYTGTAYRALQDADRLVSSASFSEARGERNAAVASINDAIDALQAARASIRGLSL